MYYYSIHAYFLVELIIIHRIINNKYEIYLEMALVINKSMYDDEIISYHLYRLVENKILEKIGNNIEGEY